MIDNAKSILITGGAGFIGSALIRYLINNTNHTVINVDKLTYAANEMSLKEINNNPRYFFVKEDIVNEIELSIIFKKFKPDFVMNLAAESHVDKSISGPKSFIETNILGTFNLLEISKNYYYSLDEIKKKSFKFHHISTDEVFGDLTPNATPFTEEHQYKPSSPYSASKASSDHLVRAWGRTYGLPTVISNCSNNYGPYQHSEKLIPKVIMNALKKDKITVYGSGEQVRDWLYVNDHVKALYHILFQSKDGESYNVGGNNEKTNIEVISTICDILDELRPPTNIKSYSSLITHIEDRPGHDERYAIDAKKILKDLNWKPEESFESGIRKTVEWYLKNEIFNTDT